MAESTSNKSSTNLWWRVLAALITVPVAILVAAPAAGAVDSEEQTTVENEQLPLPIPGLPGETPSPDELVSLLGECVAALIETVVGAVPADAVPAAGEQGDVLPATDALKPCLDLLTQLGLPVSLPDLPVPLEEPAAEE